ncbi:MAG TPA: ABC transporter permease subunit [Gammaproteobacteria bacterium]|nr:ABC transporter permease subunit [Gammaproteobacteria bacterium]
MNRRRSPLVLAALALGVAFLYVPILSVVVYSFNESRLVTVWGGFSTKWYRELLADRQMLEGVWLSLRIAVTSASAAAVLGTLAGLALARFGRFRGRALLSGMVTAPLVMPDVIMGLSLLLLFVALAPLPLVPDERGFATIAAAHVTLAMSYVTVIVQSRLAVMDESLEEAAMDLGARPLKVFLVITLPLIAPAVVSGWLLAFTLSLDDLVLASFTAGPSTNTLPMMIFSKVRLGVTPEVNAIATLMIGAVTLCVAAAGLLMARRERSRRRAAAARLSSYEPDSPASDTSSRYFSSDKRPLS